MPQISIPINNFMEMDIYTQKYNVRYRIVTENQNSFSYWSPIFEVDPEFIFWRGTIDYAGSLYVEKLGTGFVSLTWDPVTIYKEIDGSLTDIGKLQMYDIWIKWTENGGANPSDWIYKERLSSTSVTLNIPPSYLDSGGTPRNPKQVYVEIYRPGRPILRYEQTYGFPQNSTTVDTTNDWIDFGQGHGSSTGTAGLYMSATPIGGLTSGNTYYTRTINYTTIALYPTKQDSLDDTNKINLTSTGSGTGSFTGFPFKMYEGSKTSL